MASRSGAYLYFGKAWCDGIALADRTEPDMGEFVLESLFEHRPSRGCTVVRARRSPT